MLHEIIQAVVLIGCRKVTRIRHLSKIVRVVVRVLGYAETRIENLCQPIQRIVDISCRVAKWIDARKKIAVVVVRIRRCLTLCAKVRG